MIKSSKGRLTIETFYTDGRYAKARGVDGKVYRIDLDKCKDAIKATIKKSIRQKKLEPLQKSGIKGYGFAKYKIKN